MAKKFNVGDKVRIVSEHQFHWADNGEMDKWAGKVVTVKKYPFFVPSGVQFEECPQWVWHESDIEEVLEAASAQTPKFKVGQKVRIKGDAADFTECLDGKVGVITEVRKRDCWVDVDGHRWGVWFGNMTVVEDAEETEEAHEEANEPKSESKKTEKTKKLSPVDAPNEFDINLAHTISEFTRSVIALADEFNVERKEALVLAAKAVTHSANDDFFWDVIVPMDELAELMDK